MARGKHLRLLVALVAMFALLAPHATASASPSDEASFVSKVNGARASAGLPALQTDGQLTSLARGWATSMKDGVCGAGNNICHASPISAGVTHDWAKLGENVGTGPDIDSVMSAFIASPGHYANIVDPDFTHVGIGVVWDGPRLYVTQRFMKLQGAPPPPPTTTTAAPEPDPDPPTSTAPDPNQQTTTTQRPTATTGSSAPRTNAPPIALERAQAWVRALTRLLRNG